MEIPNDKATRSDSELGHFYTNMSGESGTGFYCRMRVFRAIRPNGTAGPDILGDTDVSLDGQQSFCNEFFVASASTRRREKHLRQAHFDHHEAVCNFRAVQEGVHHPERLIINTDNNLPNSPCHCESGIKSGDEINQINANIFFQDLLLRLITTKLLSMATIQSPEFKSLMSYANPILRIPTEDTLWH